MCIQSSKYNKDGPNSSYLELKKSEEVSNKFFPSLEKLKRDFEKI